MKLTPLQTMRFNYIIAAFDYATGYAFDDVTSVKAIYEISRARKLWSITSHLEDLFPNICPK